VGPELMSTNLSMPVLSWGGAPAGLLFGRFGAVRVIEERLPGTENNTLQTRGGQAGLLRA
jgi:hypothetical protein